MLATLKTNKTTKLSALFMIAFAIIAVISTNVTASASSLHGARFSTTARSAIVLELHSNRIFYEKNADEQLAIASTTKILTAITVIENTVDLYKTVTVPAEAVGVEGSSIYLQHEEQLRIIDLLYGLMLQSGNDCAEALAILTGGSVERFAKLMCATAHKIGATDCNFVNPHGLTHKEHHCSARELGMIAAYAMKDGTFRKIVSAEVYRDCPYAGRDYNRLIKNKNKILTTVEGGNGIKTGYTKAAGRCLVSSATRNGFTVITVVLNCGPMFEESAELIETSFDIIKKECNDLNHLIS